MNTIIFDGEKEKFAMFENFFQTILKMQLEISKAMKINRFYSNLLKEALQTSFTNINAGNKQTPGDVLNIFQRKHVRKESHATAKHKWQ